VLILPVNSLIPTSLPHRLTNMIIHKILTITFIGLFLSACGNANNSSQSTSSVSQEKITLRLAHGWPKGFPYFGESVEKY